MFLFLAMLPMVMMAQISKNVTVANAGELKNQISDEEKFRVSVLSVSGPLNGNDIKLLQEMVNRSKASEKKGEYLVTKLDLSGAMIMEGKDGMKLKANELPNGCFSGAKGLISVSLPRALTSISKNCFSDCNNLVEVVIPGSVKEIETALSKTVRHWPPLVCRQVLPALAVMPSTTARH